jgi:hypothetical protein
MLKYLQENLAVGDFVEVETSAGTVRGSITALLQDRLKLLIDDEQHELFEEHLLGVKYISDEHDAYHDCYIQKFIPVEKEKEYFWGKNHNGTLVCSNYDDVIKLYFGENKGQLCGHVDLPDMIDVEDEYHYVELLGVGFVSDDWPVEHITSIKLPKKSKYIDQFIFRRSYFLQKILVPNTLVESGGYKVGGCATCQVFDLNGKPLDWEFEEDW